MICLPDSLFESWQQCRPTLLSHVRLHMQVAKHAFCRIFTCVYECHKMLWSKCNEQKSCIFSSVLDLLYGYNCCLLSSVF